MPADSTWQSVTGNTQARHSLAKLLRLAVFYRHIATIQREPTTSDIEPVLQASLMGDEDKEFESLLAYLMISADDLENVSIPELAAVGKAMVFNESDLMLDLHSRDVRFRLQYMPDSYLRFYEDNLYR